MSNPTDLPVTMLGLGPMGQALAGAFLVAGHPTTVWNRTAAKADTLSARGARKADTVAEAVGASPLVVVCLIDDAAVHATLGPVADALGGRTLVNVTSTAPEQSRQTARWAAEHGIGYLDGAIMTPTPTIGQPSALVLYSGSATAHQEHLATLTALGGTATYLGAEPGLAAAHDVALLSVFWLAVGGIVHGLALARAEGIAGGELAPYAQGIFGLLPEMMTRFAAQADAGSYPGERSTIASAEAGLRHIMETAAANDIDTGVLAASRALVTRAIAAGHGADGLSRLAEVLGRSGPA